MVQFSKSMKGITPFAIGALALYGCTKEDEDVKPVEEEIEKEEELVVVNSEDQLLGEWKILSVDGEPFGENYDGYTYSVGFKFEANGDFGYCYEGIYEADPIKNESYCELNGEWEWVDEEQTELKLTQFYEEDNYTFFIVIDSLTEDHLEGDFYTEDDPDIIYEVIFEKYDFED